MNYWEIKQLVLEKLGGKCMVCGETNIKELHTIFSDPDMQHYRKTLGLESTEAFYRFLYRHDSLDKYKKGKYKLSVLCKKHYNIFASEIRKNIPRSEEVKAKISQTMKSKKKVE